MEVQNNNTNNMSMENKPRKCSKCKTNSVEFLCLDEQCIRLNANLFCRSCNKQQKKRHKTYIIDKESAPLSLFGLNCFNQNKKQFVQFLQNTMEKCSTQWNQNMQKVVMKHQNMLQQQIFNHLNAIIQTCEQQKTQQVYKLMIQTSCLHIQAQEPLNQELLSIQKNIQLMKWIQNNESFIRDVSASEKALQFFSKKYQTELNKLFKKINFLFQKFFQEFNSKTLFSIQNQQIKQNQKSAKNQNNKFKKIKPQSKVKNQTNQTKTSQPKKEVQKSEKNVLSSNENLNIIEPQKNNDIQKSQNKDVPALYKSQPNLSQQKIKQKNNEKKISQNQILKNEYFQSKNKNYHKNYPSHVNGIKSQNFIQDQSKKNQIISEQKQIHYNNDENNNLPSSILTNQEFVFQQKKLMQEYQNNKKDKQIPKQISVKIQASQYSKNSQPLQKIQSQKQRPQIVIQKQNKKIIFQKLTKDKKNQQIIKGKKNQQIIVQKNLIKKPFRNKQQIMNSDLIYRLATENCDKFLQRETEKIKCLYLQSATPYFLNNPKNYDSLFNTNQLVQEIHIFDPEFSKERLYDLLLAYPNLTKLIINCDNDLQNLIWYFQEKLTSEMYKKQKLNINKYQSLYGMQIIDASGINYQDIQIIDSKKYFPQKLFCPKVLDERWKVTNIKINNSQKDIQIVANQQSSMEESNILNGGIINIKDQKQKLAFSQSFSTQNPQLKTKKNKNNSVEKSIAQGHTQICWYYYQDYPKKDYRYFKCPLKQQSLFTLLQLNPSLRNFSLADLTQTTLFKQKMEKVDLTWIQEVTLGHYTKILQPIPKEILVKLTKVQNIQSLTFLNLNISELTFGMLFKYTQNLKSLILQFCTPLSNFFYKNLYRRAPNLKKLSVNNLKNVKGEFIGKLKHLQTLILPWSQIDMNQSDSNQKFNQQNQEIQEQFSPLKLNHINLYGSNWILEKQFFLMLDEKSIKSLNIGKMSLGPLESSSELKKNNVENILQKLASLQNLTELCLDGLPITTKNLIDFLSMKSQKNNFLKQKSQNILKLSIAHCQNVNLDDITEQEWKLFNNFTHLDLRNKNSKWNQNLQNLKSLKHLCFDLSDDIQKSLRIKKMLSKNVFVYQ